MRRILTRSVILALLASAVLSSTVFAQSVPVVVRTRPGTDIRTVVAGLRGTLLDSTGENVHLVSVPAIPSVHPAGVDHVELDSLQVSQGPGGVLFSVKAGTDPDFYRNQPALLHINLPGVPARATGRSIVIADINASVDVGHPALIGHLTSGAQFLAGTTCSNTSTLNDSEVGFLDDSEVGFLDDSEVGFLDDSEVGFLDQASVSFVDGVTASSIDKMAPAHGHGTMVAGILAAIAPDAMIMPLQAFDDNGCASIYNISKAIKYAVTHGAQVINMSFGISTEAQTLKEAIKEAVDAGVTVVAAAGNSNISTPQYPADYPGVISVAATDLKDVKASFSNYGKTITVSAPGVGIISAYPGGYYAALSGTSFSAPMVAAEAALCRSLRTSDCDPSIINGVDNINAVNPSYINELGSGRINLVKALQ